MSQKRANCSGPGKGQWGPRGNFEVPNGIAHLGDEPTRNNVARGKKFGAPGEVPFYPRGQRRFKTRRAHSHISLQGCVVTLSTRYSTLLNCDSLWAKMG